MRQRAEAMRNLKDDSRAVAQNSMKDEIEKLRRAVEEHNSEQQLATPRPTDGGIDFVLLGG